MNQNTYGGNANAQPGAHSAPFANPNPTGPTGYANYATPNAQTGFGGTPSPAYSQTETPPASAAAPPFEESQRQAASSSNPLPLAGSGSAGFTLRIMDWSGITSEKDLCHRASLSGTRVGVLGRRILQGEQLPPVIVYEKVDGSHVLLDGFHRREVAFRLGKKNTPALIVAGSPAKAICCALRVNIPRKPGSLRDGDDAMRALTILATALGRPITEDEARTLGIKHVDHKPLDAMGIGLLSLPGLNGDVPPFVPARKKPGKIGSPRRNGKRGTISR